ncbi:SCO7613 C-terminal domain-containing membrane protein [Micromonosporaceae bacterium Da 78-11]
MTYPCPNCSSPATLPSGCPACGRGPDPDAAEVVRLDAEIAGLNVELARARQAVREIPPRIEGAWLRRNAAATRVRAGRSTPVPAPVPAPAFETRPVPAVVAAPARSPEASTKLVQNALFLLGGLLLAVAAIVFTAVAWAQFGVGGRSALLAFFTGAALAVPPLALRRKLAATAETFAAVGLLLVLLDGYAAWYVNLFGVADRSPWGYAGAVCAVTAAVAAGYEHLTGLTGPRFAALVVAQPVLPLLILPAHPDATGWSLTFTAVAALDVAVLALRRTGFRLTGIGIAAYLCGAVAVAIAGCCALAGLILARTPAAGAAAGGALLAAALVPLGAALLARTAIAQAIAVGLLVVALDVAAIRFTFLLGSDLGLLRVTGVTLAVVALAAVARRLLPPVVARGPRIGALAVIAVPALATLALTAEAAFATLDTAGPFLDTAWTAAVPYAGWPLPFSILLLAAALLLTLPPSWRGRILLAAALLAALALPAGLHLRWWSAPILDLAVTAVALALAIRHVAPARPGLPVSFGTQILTAVLLGLHAVVTGFGRPTMAAAVLGAVAVLGLATAALSYGGPRRRDLGGAGLLTGLVAVPAVAWTTTDALGGSATLQSRLVLAAVAVPVAALHRTGRGYRPFALAAVLLTVVSAPVWALASGDSPAVYAAVALLLLAAALPAAVASSALPVPPAAGPVALADLPPTPVAGALATNSTADPATGVGPVPVLRLPVAGLGWIAFTAVPLALALLVATGRSLFRVLVQPYEWLGLIWSGRPTGLPYVPAADAVAVFLPVLAATFAAYVLAADPDRAPAAGGRAARAVAGSGSVRRRTAGRVAVPFLAVAVPVILAAAEAPWPTLPAVELALGLAGLLVAVLRRTPTSIPVVAAVLAGAGLAGALPTHGSTLAALGTVLVTAAAAGSSGRTEPLRVTGWLIAVAAAFGVAVTAGDALELDLRTVAFIVLAVAAAVFALSWLLTDRPIRRADHPVHRNGEARAVEAAAHAGAVLALLLSVGSARYAAMVCILWGVALGVRALGTHRHAYVVAAAVAELVGWCLLMDAAHIWTVEVYTIPAAAVALLAGLLARRRQPRLSSWVAYGPALAAALLPSLASIAGSDSQYLRRLLLGLAALAIVLAGANARLQAPVVLGGGVLILVALHELGQVWDLIPRWIPLAAGGLILVLLAITLERRRRDLARFREALTRMS